MRQEGVEAVHRIRGRLLPLLAVVATICIVASGCGGGDDEPAAAERKEPKALKAFSEYLAELIAEADEPADCGRLREISRRSLEDIPCPAPEDLREDMGSFDIADSAQFMFSRIGIVDYEPTEADRRSMLLFMAPRGGWSVGRLSMDVGEAPGNTGNEGHFNIRKAMLGWEKAVRRRDCEGQLRFAFRPAGAPRPTCEEQLARTRKLARVLNLNTAQLPAFAGGDPDFGIYSYTSFDDGVRWHFTFLLIKAPLNREERWFVLDEIQDEPAPESQRT